MHAGIISERGDVPRERMRSLHLEAARAEYVTHNEYGTFDDPIPMLVEFVGAGVGDCVGGFWKMLKVESTSKNWIKRSNRRNQKVDFARSKACRSARPRVRGVGKSHFQSRGSGIEIS